MKALRKKRNSSGFSLAETLVAVLILLMVSAVVAAGLPAACKAYENAADAANAQTLLNTTATALRAELCEASDVELISDSENEVVSFRSSRTGAKTVLTGSGGDGICLRDFADVTGANATEPYPLVSTAMAGNTLRTAYDSITYDKDAGIFTVNGLRVERGGAEVAALDAFSIRTVNP